jgi:hypothetical protein
VARDLRLLRRGPGGHAGRDPAADGRTLAAGAFDAFAFRLSFATIGLVLTLRLPANPISWLYAAAGLVWSLDVPAADPGVAVAAPAGAGPTPLGTPRDGMLPCDDDEPRGGR